MNFSDFRVFRTFDTLPFKRLLLHIFQKTNNREVVFVPEDVDGAREMVETIIFRVCISQGYPIFDMLSPSEWNFLFHDSLFLEVHCSTHQQACVLLQWRLLFFPFQQYMTSA